LNIGQILTFQGICCPHTARAKSAFSDYHVDRNGVHIQHRITFVESVAEPASTAARRDWLKPAGAVYETPGDFCDEQFIVAARGVPLVESSITRPPGLDINERRDAAS
jgi:hypothetical protein